MHKPDRLLRMTRTVIPYRLRAISFATRTSALDRKYGVNEAIDVSVGNSVDPNFEYQGTLGDISQPVESMAILHCRCLFEFLGLGIDRSSRPIQMLAVTKARAKSDIGIEHFVDDQGANLQRLTPVSAVDLLGRSGDYKVLIDAWAKTFAVANQRLAHSTTDEILNGDHAGDAIEITISSMPELICRALYDATGQPRPHSNK